MAYTHGVYVAEQATQLTAPIEGSAALQVVFGTAPIHLAENPEAAVNTPILAYSFREAAAALGYSDDWKKYTLCQVMDASFRSVAAVAPVIFVNVLDPKQHKKEITATKVDIKSLKGVFQQEGVLMETISVSSAQSDGTVYAVGEDYTVSFDEDGNVIVALMPEGAANAASEVWISCTATDASAVTETTIVGGLSVSTGAESGLEVLRQVYPKTGLVPGVLLAPGWSNYPVVAAAMQAKCESINGLFSCECLLDIDCGESGAKRYTDVQKKKTEAGMTSPHAMALWPMAQIGDKKYHASAVWGAMMHKVDAKNGDVPNLSPSNKATTLTGVCLEDGTPVLLDFEQANLLNGQGVSTFINQNGWRTWGNNSAAYPGTTDPKDRWFAVRRFFSWWGNTFIRTYFQRVDDPMNYRLIENIVDSENIRGNGYKARGMVAEAKMAFHVEENPVTDIMNGKIRFHQTLSPFPPAETIHNTLEFDPTALQSALTGGA